MDQVSFGPPTRYLRNDVLMGTELLLSRSEPAGPLVGYRTNGPISSSEDGSPISVLGSPLLNV